MTAFNSKDGGFYLTTVGRVQTPTLAILVEREEKIRASAARLLGSAGALRRQGRRVPGQLVRPEVQEGRRRRAQAPSACGARTRAEAIVAACRGKPGVVTEETKPSTQLSPLLYDLTSLQREANGRFGFSARMTLSLAQALYERHKVLTYPRTDSRALPEDYLGTVKETLKVLARARAFSRLRQADPEAGLGQAEQAHLRQQQGLGPLRDHPDAADAQAPERGRAEALRPGGAALPRGVLSAAEYLQTTRITRVEGISLQDRRQGAGERRAGWRSTARAGARTSENLPPIAPRREGRGARDRRAGQPDQAAAALHRGDAALGDGRRRQAGRGRRAARGDGAKGLGTPATRAAIIEGLIREEYMHREGRELSRRQGVLADVRAAQAAHRRARLARAHRRMGAQAQADRGGKLTREEFMRRST